MSHCASPSQAFARIGNTACHNIATITGPAGFGAGVNRSGPHNDGDANTDTIQVRCVILLPFSSAGPFLSTRSTGRYGLQEFYNTFIQPGFAANNALWTPVQNWFRLAVTQDVNNNPVLGITPVTSGIPADTAGLNAAVTATKNGLQRMAGPVGPGASCREIQTQLPSRSAGY